MLFADVRGSTALGEKLRPQAFAATLDRFYHAATEALIQHDAIVDKLIGDEVMALFIPGICVECKGLSTLPQRISVASH